jgi:hypothetical protein
MTIERMDDAPVLDQIDEIGWQKFLALIVFKLAPNGVTLTSEDVEQFAREDKVLFSHGLGDRFEFKMVTREEAERIAAHEAGRRGRA